MEPTEPKKFKSLREKIAWEKAQRSLRYAKFEEILTEAHQAGLKAAREVMVSPMVVQEHENPADDSSAVKQQWVVPDGVCGFAWVTVRPANSSFGRYVKKNKGWRPAWNGGIQLWVSDFGQSMIRKEAYAGAFASVLRNHDINANMGSRMD